MGFALNIEDLSFSSMPEYTCYGLIFGFIINIVFVRILPSSRLNLLFTLEHECTHALFALVPRTIIASDDGTGTSGGEHNLLSSIAPYFFPLYSLFTLILLGITEREYLRHFQFFIGFFYINFWMENLYQIFIMKTEDIFYEGHSFINIVLITLGNLVIFGVIASILTEDLPFEFIKHGFIHSADVYSNLLEHIRDSLLKAGGAR
jgi:hypothetical protein